MSEHESSYRLKGGIPDVPQESFWDRIWTPFWMIPAVSVVAALLFGTALPELESRLGGDPLLFAFRGGTSASREVLGVIASATISVTGLVFSNTLVVLQLVNSSFSPRMLNGFLQSRIVQGTLAIFLATFTFSLTVTRYVWDDGDDGQGFVPRLSVTVAFMMALGCLAFFLVFIRHIMSSMKVANAVTEIGQETLRLGQRMYDTKSDVPALATGPTWSPSPGDRREHVLTSVTGAIVWFNYRRLLDWAQEHGVVITIDRSVGDFLVAGQSVLRVWCDDEAELGDLDMLADAVGIRMERTMTQDVAFGLRQLVDIADRALSPGTNDPTTAVQAVHEIHRVLRYLVTCSEPSPYIADGEGAVRVVHRPQKIAQLIAEPIREIHNYAEGSAQVPEVLHSMVEDLREVSIDAYVPTLDRCRDLLARESGSTE
ncbi:DUF2254 domain-containing protein [Corynebacterium alimapuense]|uniref:DUF2254 domain-containing protein n=1 Tax=Corynebacterium alimapuense TaxID=1576874 RepID=A0A3M8KB95_9CORY|nr:DUF2254 family protein [Corynebacterium alimapuense]RNE49814.1 DUF2254 domain-containing protein [Corynebacterium alimapuense]